MFARINIAFSNGKQNQKTIKGQESFVTGAGLRCGDSLTLMNTAAANDQLQESLGPVRLAYSFTLTLIIYICIETVLLLVVLKKVLGIIKFDNAKFEDAMR